MSSSCRIALIVGLAAFGLASRHAGAASIYTENWTTPGDSRGWFIGALGGAGTPAYSGDGVSWTASSGASFGWLTGFQAQGQSFASAGNFAGNYPAAGIKGFAFDFALDSDSLNNAGPPVLRILFTSVVAGGFNSYWLHDFAVTPAIGGGLQHYFVPLEAGSWTQYLGSFAFADAIQNIQTVEVDYFRLGNYSSYVQTGRFKNFSTVGVPEPATAPLGAAAAVALVANCRRRAAC